MNHLHRYKIVLFAALLLAASFSSCRKFLEEKPKNLVTIENYYQTQADAIAAVNSIYSYLNSIDNFATGGNTAGVYHSTFWVTAGLASDEMENNQIGAAFFDQISTFIFSPQNPAFQEMWTLQYKTITLANIAIDRIPAIDMDNALRSRLVGEAKFLRGLMYFNLVRMFGSIPLLLHEDAELYPSKASEDEIYAQIIADFTDAASILPASYDAGNGRGRATAGAANALLAKVYLTRQDWQNASSFAKKVIDSGNYALWEDYADVFKLANRGGKEAIFSVGFGDANGAIIFWEQGQFNVRLLPRELSVEGVQNSQGWQRPTQFLYNSYNPNDRRRSVNFITEVTDPATNTTTSIHPYFSKYWDRTAEPKGNGSSQDFPVIRYAEVLLIYAEAQNELGNTAEAVTYLNMIRKRASFDGTTDTNAVPPYAGLSQDEARTAILQERFLELPAEGQRWFDLVRTGQLEQRVPMAKPNVSPGPSNYEFPIPQREIDLNPHLN